MLYLSIPVSIILIAVGQFAARHHPEPIRWDIVVGAGISVGLLGCAGFLLVPPLVMCVFLLVSLIAWKFVRQRRRSFLPFSIGSLVGAYAVCGYVALGTVERFQHIRHQYPYQSMENRVPAPPSSKADMELNETTNGRPLQFEERVEAQLDELRVRNLQSLHEETVRQFVNSPGFGMMRMLPGPYEPAMRAKQRDPAPAQFVTSPIEVEKPRSASVTYEAALRDLHLNSMLDFTNPAGFGFVKDRRHVAGFQPHAFSRTPEAGHQWKVESIELVGLLLHSEPVIYQSLHLPAMEELRGAKTRQLDRFETDAILAVRRGEELVPGMKDEHLRLFGAIRSARQCVDCHGGQRGDLLGAFSYTLRRIEPKK
jgi:hypothetical protein